MRHVAIPCPVHRLCTGHIARADAGDHASIPVPIKLILRPAKCAEEDRRASAAQKHLPFYIGSPTASPYLRPRRASRVCGVG